ncbi:MAG: hypothetical protein JWO07_567 [Candidatus Saccharibacteria bacterium]|nr:hypothetical protein [Candidatus Saccharibacteria bacterium]
MEFIRKLGIVESICALNFLSFLAIWWLDGGLYNSRHGLIFDIDITTFIFWLVTAIPALIASVYGLLHMSHLDRDDRQKRLMICSICIVTNVVLIAAMTVPNSIYSFQIINHYFYQSH